MFEFLRKLGKKEAAPLIRTSLLRRSCPLSRRNLMHLSFPRAGLHGL